MLPNETFYHLSELGVSIVRSCQTEHVSNLRRKTALSARRGNLQPVLNHVQAGFEHFDNLCTRLTAAFCEVIGETHVVWYPGIYDDVLSLFRQIIDPIAESIRQGMKVTCKHSNHSSLPAQFSVHSGTKLQESFLALRTCCGKLQKNSEQRPMSEIKILHSAIAIGEKAQAHNRSHNSNADIDKIFAELRKVIAELGIPEGKQREVRELVDQMEAAKGTPSFTQHYLRFAQFAADHIEIGGFLALLGKLIAS